MCRQANSARARPPAPQSLFPINLAKERRHRKAVRWLTEISHAWIGLTEISHAWIGHAGRNESKMVRARVVQGCGIGRRTQGDQQA